MRVVPELIQPLRVAWQMTRMQVLTAYESHMYIHDTAEFIQLVLDAYSGHVVEVLLV